MEGTKIASYPFLSIGGQQDLASGEFRELKKMAAGAGNEAENAAPILPNGDPCGQEGQSPQVTNFEFLAT